MDRTRTFTWQDPMIDAAAAQTMPGLDFLRAMIRGELPPPPIAAMMGLRLTEAEEGRTVFTLEPAEYHYNPIGVVHGGVAFTLLDSAMGCAVQTTLPAGTGYTTVDLHVNLVRAITAQTGLLRCEAEIVHGGRRIATAQGRIIDAGGKLYAHGTTTCMILAGREG